MICVNFWYIKVVLKNTIKTGNMFNYDRFLLHHYFSAMKIIIFFGQKKFLSFQNIEALISPPLYNELDNWSIGCYTTDTQTWYYARRFHETMGEKVTPRTAVVQRWFGPESGIFGGTYSPKVGCTADRGVSEKLQYKNSREF